MMEGIIQKFLDFEKKNNLLNDRIKDIQYWAIIRENIYNDILNHTHDIGVAHTTYSNRPFIEKIKLVSEFAFNVFINNTLFLREKDILIMNHPRRVKNGKYFECLYTDQILETIPYSYYVFENTSLEKHLKPAKTKNLKYTDSLNFNFYFSFFLSKITGGPKLNRFEEEYIKKLITKINNCFNVHFDPDEYLIKIKNQLLMHLLLYKQYERILRKIKPKLIVQVISYERRRKALNSVAKKMKVPTVELQHGVMGKYHIAYNFAERTKVDTFPDYIFLFGEFWKDTTSFPVDDSKIKVVGWPYYEQKANIHRNNVNKNNKKVILFISQGTIGKDLSKIAVQISERINTDEYKVIYKLHPGEYARWKTEYPWLKSADIEVIDNNNYDMHYYFAQSDIQIGVYSTALFEGLGYGLKTYIFKLFGHKYMNELYNKNLATLIESPEQFINTLHKEKRNQSIQIEYFWKRNSKQNIYIEIEKIMKSL
ncbi:MAG: hypothetical protein H0Z33_17095 [Bacillaceae bacterium]|nr:hypothetical protein [Bacillaceae bacterium]